MSGFRSKKTSKETKSNSASKRAGPSVAKEDVNVRNPGKRAREISPAEAKPRKKAGKRLMDYTG